VAADTTDLTSHRRPCGIFVQLFSVWSQGFIISATSARKARDSTTQLHLEIHTDPRSCRSRRAAPLWADQLDDVHQFLLGVVRDPLYSDAAFGRENPLRVLWCSESLMDTFRSWLVYRKRCWHSDSFHRLVRIIIGLRARLAPIHRGDNIIHYFVYVGDGTTAGYPPCAAAIEIDS